MILNFLFGIMFFNDFFCDALYIIRDEQHHPRNIEESWTLNIVHTNDMHSRFEETNAASAECSPREKAAEQCYGGFARVATLLRKARKIKIPTLFLNAGDTFQGSPWYNLYKWKIVAKFLNILKPDVATLGNHEFDDGIEGLVPFLKNATFPIVTCNLDLSGEPEIAAIVKKSVVLNVEDKRIGVIGYLTSESGIIPDIGRIIIHDEIKSIRKEIKKLQDDGVDIIIGLGHSGYDVDKRIAAEVEGLDLIIGGHSHSFLYTGNKPDSEEPVGLYPTEIVQKSGRKVYVVQAAASTKYLGDITVTFNSSGEVTKITGSPILLNNKIEQAPDVVKEINKLKPAVTRMIKRPVGHTKVFLNGARSVCRKQECNMGNLITDAMVESNRAKYSENCRWTDAAIAVYNSGNIRSSISKPPSEPITYGDVLTVLPFGDYMGKTTITGKQLIQMLEHSVAEFRENNTQFSGQFLQYSGIQVTYDISKPVGYRVLLNAVYARCAKCSEPKYEKLDYNKNYTILVHDYLYNGGNNFNMFKTPHSIWTTSGLTMDRVLENYIEKMKYLIHVGTERRIKFFN